MTPRTPEQFAALREESRERILRSALALFAQHGYESTSVRAIARDAGISQGLLYNYFAGKEELLREIFLRGMEDVRESFSRAALGASPADRLESLIRSSFEIVRGNLEFWRLSYGLRMQPEVLQGLAEEVGAWSAAIRAELERLLRAAGVENAGVEASVLFALIDGVAQHFALDPTHYPLAAVEDAIVARYRALSSPEGAGRAHPMEATDEH